MKFYQWLPNILLKNTYFGKAAKVNGSSFPDVLALLDFLKACRDFPDICSPSPLNGLVSPSFPMLNPIFVQNTYIDFVLLTDPDGMIRYSAKNRGVHIL